jgi:ferric-dicitrate binding protein FerR (iron transport regulator)
MEIYSRASSRMKTIRIRGGMSPRRSNFASLLVGVGLLISWIAAGSTAHAATPPGSSAASAASVTGNNVEVNGTPMHVGATLFPGDVIRLGEASTAALRFGNSVVLAAPLTELVVESEGVTLRDGRLQARAGGAEAFAIFGPFFRVNIAAFGGIQSSAEVRLGGLRAAVSSVAGAADVTASGSEAAYRLHAGETATLDATGEAASAGQAAASPVAGQVSRLVPQVQIDRASQHLQASVSDRIYWNDGLRSGPTGRAHVALTDGSQLNLGSDSSLRILQHDAQAQQTSLDLLMGRLRGKITKLTRPGAKFEIQTPVGVAGLVGTDLSLLVTSDYVEMMVFEGAVRFTTLNGQVVSVTAGNKLRITRTGVVEGPSPAGSQEAQIAKDLTDILAQANQSTVATASRPLIPIIVTVTGAAAAIAIGVWEGTRPAESPVVP